MKLNHDHNDKEGQSLLLLVCMATAFDGEKGYSVSFLQERFDKMRSHREPFETEWDLCDLQFDAMLEETNDGKLLVNNTMEQDYIEMTVGRRAGHLDFNVLPDPYEPNIADVDIARHVLTKRIEDEGVYKQVRLWRNDKAKYGTAVFYTGIRYERELYWKPKEDAESTAEAGFGLFDGSQYKEAYKEHYYFGPINVPLRYFFVDERALYQSDFDVAVDCFMIEPLTKEEVEMRYKNKPQFNQKAIETMEPISEDDKAYGIAPVEGRVLLYHYFNREKKRYAIMINKADKLYEGPQLFKHGKNPFSMCQHHTDTRFLYGIGICRKVRPWKATKNVMLQGIIDGARLSSGKILGLGASGELLDGDLWVDPGEINVVRMTNAIEQTRPLDTEVNISQLQSALPIIDSEGTVSTGIDLRSPFEMPENVTTLGQTEILEENKATRAKTVDENEDEAIDWTLTMFLSNMQQFMPYLGRVEYEVDDEGEQHSVTAYPKITIKDVKVRKKDDKQYIEEDLGNYGYLEFSPDVIEGNLEVRVITPSTYNRTLSIIEKNKWADMVDKYSLLAERFGPEVVQEEMGVDYVMDKMRIAYGYGRDQEDMAMSKKQEQLNKNKKLLKSLHDLFDTNMSNAKTPQITGAANQSNQQSTQETGDQEQVVEGGEQPTEEEAAMITD